MESNTKQTLTKWQIHYRKYKNIYKKAQEKKYTCECGVILRKDAKHHHLKSKNHYTLLESLT